MGNWWSGCFDTGANLKLKKAEYARRRRHYMFYTASCWTFSVCFSIPDSFAWLTGSLLPVALFCCMRIFLSTDLDGSSPLYCSFLFLQLLSTLGSDSVSLCWDSWTVHALFYCILILVVSPVVTESLNITGAVKSAVKQIASPGICQFCNHYRSVYFSVSHSPLFLQLHCSHGDSAVSWLPRRLWEQPQLRMADNFWAGLQNSLGLQWLWLGASLWFPHHQRWRPVRGHNTGALFRRRGSFSPDVQQQRPAAGVSGWSLHVRPRVQYHLQQ